MKKLIILFVGALLVSCSQPNPSFDGNVNLAKSWFEKWQAEDIDGLAAMISDDVEWQGAFYGQPLMTNKSDVLDYINGWIGSMEDISYTPENYLPGVDPETNMPNGSVRTYGTWTGKNTASGKNFEVLFYHYMTFDENGMIINGGDFGDATGTVVAVSE